VKQYRVSAVVSERDHIRLVTLAEKRRTTRREIASFGIKLALKELENHANGNALRPDGRRARLAKNKK
jgi:hypothetical protein